MVFSVVNVTLSVPTELWFDVQPANQGLGVTTGSCLDRFSFRKQTVGTVTNTWRSRKVNPSQSKA
jgi:hypothetical protein